MKWRLLVKVGDGGRRVGEAVNESMTKPDASQRVGDSVRGGAFRPPVERGAKFLRAAPHLDQEFLGRDNILFDHDESTLAPQTLEHADVPSVIAG